MVSKGRIAAAMSGGVDSAVAAALLKERGYDVIGLTLSFRPCGYEPDTSLCCGGDGNRSARQAADATGIRHYIIECHVEFERSVLRPAMEEYASGRTPSPCIRCNELLKFGYLWERARALGADKVSTGHYARIAELNGVPALLRGAEAKKDQSYFLFSLTREQLSRTLFPLGGMTKADVREEARRLGLPNSERPESQDACLFAGGEGFAGSLFGKFGGVARPGKIVHSDGRVLGTHTGVHRYTIGQRRGLGVALGRRAWVVALDPETGTVVLDDDEASLLVGNIKLTGVTMLADMPDEFGCEVQIRSTHRAAKARVMLKDGDGTAEVTFEQPQKSAAPGQAAVFYDGDKVLGGGWIRSTVKT